MVDELVCLIYNTKSRNQITDHLGQFTCPILANIPLACASVHRGRASYVSSFTNVTSFSDKGHMESMDPRSHAQCPLQCATYASTSSNVRLPVKSPPKKLALLPPLYCHLGHVVEEVEHGDLAGSRVQVAVEDVLVAVIERS